jgi:hypothetical protein
LYEIGQKNYIEHLEKIDQVEEWLPKVLSDPSKAKKIIEGIEMLAKVKLEDQGMLNMYETIRKMHNAVKRTFPDLPESSGSKGSDTLGQDTTASQSSDGSRHHPE